MKTIIRIAAIAACTIALTSCKSKEEKVVSRLDSLSERIEKNGHKFDTEDWEEALEDLEDIHEDMEDCEFSIEELKKIGKADGRLSAIIAKEGAKALGRDFSSVLKSFSSFAKGFQEGAMENYSEDDFKELEDQMNSALEEIEDAWKE